MFGNIGFMGIPIIAAIFPKQGMLYIALFTVVDQLLPVDPRRQPDGAGR